MRLAYERWILYLRRFPVLELPVVERLVRSQIKHRVTRVVEDYRLCLPRLLASQCLVDHEILELRLPKDQPMRSAVTAQTRIGRPLSPNQSANGILTLPIQGQVRSKREVYGVSTSNAGAGTEIITGAKCPS